MKTAIPIKSIPYAQAAKAIDTMRSLLQGDLKASYTIQELADLIGAKLSPEAAELSASRPEVMINKNGDNLEFINLGPELEIKANLGTVKIKDRLRLVVQPRDEELVLLDAEGIIVSIIFMTKKLTGGSLKISRADGRVRSAEIELK